MRRSSHDHGGDVGSAVRAFLRSVDQVLGANVEVVVGVIAVTRDHGVEPGAEVVDHSILQFVDQQRDGRMGAEGDGATVGDARVLDRPPKIVGQVDHVEPVGWTDPDGKGG